jgi:glycosyltransferase involved in cell wall biosynthesis
MTAKNNSVILSIVVPTLYPQKYLPELFASLHGIDLSLCEILVINMGSVSVSELQLDSVECQIRELVPEQRLACTVARNYGAKHAIGKFVIFLDDDCTLGADKAQFNKLISTLSLEDDSVFILLKCKKNATGYVEDWPKERPEKLTYFSVPKFAIEWNTVFPRELFLSTGGYCEMVGPGADSAAQCGEILIIIFKLLSKKVNLKLIEYVKVIHPDLTTSNKKSETVKKYYYGHGFSVGYAIKEIPFFYRAIIFIGFSLKFVILMLLPRLEKFMIASDLEYNHQYVRKNICCIFAGFMDGLIKGMPRKTIP